MESPPRTTRLGALEGMLRRLLTLEQLMTSSIVHLVYWMGLGIIALGGFAAVGATLGVALREPDIQGILLAIPVLVAGLLIIGALSILWRSFCELYVVVIRIGEDLSALRRVADIRGLLPREEPPEPGESAEVDERPWA